MKRKLLFVGITVAMVLSVCLALVGGYFYMRAVKHPFPTSDLRVDGGRTWQPDDALGFAPAPNARSVRRHLRSGLSYAVFSDTRGLRVATAGDETPADVDLLAVGGSFTWGHGVAGDETYPAVLARELGLKAANAGYPSYGTVQALQMLQRHRDLRPEVVTYLFIDDHLRRNLSPCAPSYSPFCSPVSHVALTDDAARIAPPPHDRAEPELSEKFRREILQSDGVDLNHVLWRARVDLMDLRWGGPLQAVDPADAARGLAYALAEMQRAAGDLGARLLVIRVPLLHEREPGPPPPALLAAMPSAATFVDLAPLVRAHYARSQTPLAIPGDGHPSVAAHRLIAGAVARALR